MAEHERRLAEFKRADEHRMMRMNQGQKPSHYSNARRGGRDRSPDTRRNSAHKTSSTSGRARRGNSRSASPKK